LKSIRRHLLGWLTAALSMGAIGLTLALYVITLEEMSEVFDEELRQVAHTVIAYFDEEGPRPATPPVTEPPAEVGLRQYAFATQVWTAQGRLLFSSVPDERIPYSAVHGYADVAGRHGHWRVYTDRSTPYVIQAAQPLQARQALATDVAIKFLLASALSVPLLAGLVAVALRRGMQPIVHTSRELERRSALSLQPIATDRLPDELHPLVSAFNALMAKLSVALSAQREFTADAAHELRTPLSALRLQVQALLLADDERVRREAAADIRQGLDRATRLVEQLLNLSRVDPDAVLPAHEPVDLAALVRSAVGHFSARAEARRIDLGADIALDVQLDALVLGDAEQLRVLLNNLIDNALRYTPGEGRVDVSLRAGVGGTLRLEVKDSGPGIAPQDRERVFDRFYRGTPPPDAPTAPGSGLGLAIVRAIANQHGATVQLAEGMASAPGAPGLSVSVLLQALTGVPSH
jgi:signal transduction histidine kinase